MLSCFDVAEYFLSLADEDAGDQISNSKLQKLVYYAQGFSLVLLGRSLFEERIEAWEHGPVVPDLYRKYRHHGSDGITTQSEIDYDKFSEEERELLDEVYECFGQFSAWKLKKLSHEEPPWKDYKGTIIPNDAMAEYFKTQVI